MFRKSSDKFKMENDKKSSETNLALEILEQRFVEMGDESMNQFNNRRGLEELSTMQLYGLIQKYGADFENMMFLDDLYRKLSHNNKSIVDSHPDFEKYFRFSVKLIDDIYREFKTKLNK